MPGHLSFLGKAKNICEHLTVALYAGRTQNGVVSQETLERRKSQLLSTKLVDKVIPIKDFDECTAVIANENIDVYAYGNPVWQINTLKCSVRYIDSGRVNLPQFNLKLGHACTLKCKACSTLAPFAPKDTYYYDMPTIIDSLKKVAAVADIQILAIQGGESFLHPSLPSLLEYAVACESISKIQVFTNGTVMPKFDNDILKNSKIEILISIYPITTDKVLKIKDFFDNNKIMNEIVYRKDWNDFGFQADKQMNKSTDRQAETTFLACAVKRCLTLEKDAIAHCPRAIIAPRVQGFVPKDDDYLYVNESSDLKSDLYNYVYHPNYMEVCKYCNGTEGTPLVEPAQQLQR
jgi:organic radical activating enzyme